MIRRDISKFIRRYKYIVNLLVGVLGIFLIFVVVMVPDLYNKNTDVYNVCMGIGCSIVATAIVTVILLVLIPDEPNDNEVLNKWGLISVYDERSKIQIDAKQFPSEKLDFIAFGLSHFRKANDNNEFMIKKLRKGLKIRILTLNPNSIHVKQQQKFENANNDIKKEILELYDWVKNIQKEYERSNRKNGEISIKFYDSLPLDFYCRADDNIYVGPYMPKTISGSTITYQFSASGSGGKYYSDIFEKIWNEEINIGLIKSYKDYFSIDQEQAVESLLKYFCNLFKKQNEKEVIGVVAIFKDRLRRTFFSCNKENIERNVCYSINEGTVGKLMELHKNATNKQYGIFCDYQNKMCFVDGQPDRNKFIKKIDYEMKKMKEDDTVAILGIPLCINNKIIGVVTFDFAELPTKYMEKSKAYKLLELEQKLEEKDVEEIKDLFRIANQCADIVIHMLGQDVETEYKRLYEEEWKEHVQKTSISVI